MSRNLLCLLLVLACRICLPAQAQDAPAAEKLIDEGLDLYLIDKNDEALDHFQQALKLKPNDFRAQYGMALVYYTTARYAESAALCEALVKRGDGKIPNLYVTYGTSLDRQQKSAEAVQVYQQAIVKFPGDEQLHLYMGIALQNMKRYEEAAGSFQQAIRLKPDESSAHLKLAQLEARRSRRVPSLLAYMRSMMTEKSASGAASSARMLTRLLQVGIKQNDAKSVTINLTPDMLTSATSPVKKPDDFAQVDVLLTMEAALDYDEKYKSKPPVERFAEKLGVLCRGLSEQKADQRLGFTWQFYAPYFIELEQKGHVKALAYVLQAMQTDATPDVMAWIKGHQQPVQAMLAWSNTYQWPK